MTDRRTDRILIARPRLHFMQRGENVAILDLSEAISRKRCKIGGKLLLITNRKSHMGFRLVPNSVNLSDLERRNSPNLCVISQNSVALRMDYVKVVGDTSILSAAKMLAKASSFY